MWSIIEVTLKERIIMDKKKLDQLMVEYYYDKNSVEDTLDFISFMFQQYEKLLDHKFNKEK